ncbi:MAG: hypothetical protein JKY88_12530 [Pseudomonadales bacterium]|nr:hypothetical protein [Pseudomonadales bacterium]
MAFLDSDVDDGVLLEKYKVSVGIETVVPQATAISRALPSETPFRLKEIVLSEGHRNLLQTIEDVLEGRFRVFVHLPLKDFVDGGSVLEGKEVSYLVCDPHYFNVLAGIDILNKDATETHFLRELFSEINKPLVLFPKKQIYTDEEVRAKLQFFAGAEQKCPNCTSSMEKRKLNSAAEQWVWVCDNYPRCKGHLKIT